MIRKLKHGIALLCVVCLCVCVAGGFTTAQATSAKVITYAEVPLYLNGELAGAGMTIDGATYVAIRAFCASIVPDAEVQWSQETTTVTVTDNGLELSVGVGESYMMANGNYIRCDNVAININGTVVVPISALSEVFGLEPEISDGSIDINTVVVTYPQYQEENAFLGSQQGGISYNEEDFYWLSRLIESEAGDQPLEGRVAVGNVVLNRVASDEFADSIYNVIFERGQFSVVPNGMIYNDPSEESIQAATMCFEGYSVVEDSLYFVNPRACDASWFQNSLRYVASIGEHVFYA